MKSGIHLEDFEVNNYYATGTDSTYLDKEKGFYVKLKQGGKDLLNQYYADKYKTEIASPNEFLLFIETMGKDKDIAKAREKKLENYRKAFILGDDQHSFLMVYLKEKDKEAILYADSSVLGNSVALDVYKEMKIPVYVVEDPRQADGYSCHTDAFVMARDMTAKDSKGEYCLKGLLSKIGDRSKEKSSLLHDEDLDPDIDPNAPIYAASIPDGTLKTSQISSFTKKHKEKTADIIYKEENLDAFTKRHEEKLLVTFDHGRTTKEKNMPRYLLIKGRKYADRIEIQFYINQLKDFFKEVWTGEVSKDFATRSKKILRAQGKIDEREGLYKFTEEYAESLFAKTQGITKPLAAADSKTVVASFLQTPKRRHSTGSQIEPVTPPIKRRNSL